MAHPPVWKFSLTKFQQFYNHFVLTVEQQYLFNKMSAIVTKATNTVNSLVAKSTQLANCAVYWGKVSAEVGKVIYKKEGLAPPSQKDFQTLYESALKFAKSSQQQKKFLEDVAAFKPTKECVVKAGVYGTQLLAFFSIGEVIGRRKVFGYPSVGIHSAHH